MARLSSWLFLAALAPLSVGVSRGAADSGSRTGDSVQQIVGNRARADQIHDSVVAVRSGGGSLCSGTVIDKSEDGHTVRVLTAAHCCRGVDPPRSIVIGGDYADGTRTAPVSGFDRHPCYSALSNEYDFCLVTVHSDDALNLKPVPLASAPDDLHAGSKVTVVGFGSTPASNTLRRVAEASLLEVASLTLAADQRRGHGGICFGDSGGPMLVHRDGREQVVGVTSFGAPTSLCNVIGVAGRVSFPGVRAEWLDKLLAGQTPTLKAQTIRRAGLNLGPVRDTYLASDAPDQSFGDRVELRVGNPRGTSAVRRALVRFDLAGVPEGVTLLTARVGFHQESRDGQGTLLIHRVLKEWDERRETWNSFGGGGFDPVPSVAADNGTAVVDATDAVWFDVTGLARGWMSGEITNLGILIREPERAEAQLMSSEIGRGSERPWLHVCYAP